MRIYDGSKLDSTNRKTTRFLEVNSCGFQKQEPGYTVVRRNGRMDYHLILVTKGTIKVIYKGTPYNLQAGGVFLYEPNHPQYYETMQSANTFYLHFTGMAAEEILECANVKAGVYALNYSPILTDYFSKLVQTFHQSGNKIHVAGALMSLLACFSDLIHRKSALPKAEIMQDILAYINQNYDRSLSVSKLSDLCGYSKSRFTHLFAEVCGISPKQYILNVRLQNACELLATGDCPIKSVAEKCGFSDALYFCRLFKKHFKLSPRAYRAQKRN